MAKQGGQRPIIIVRKKVSGHGGHHGGAWKVAYADFVTAMMAFFMVMWILGMDENVKNSIEGYFSNPSVIRKVIAGVESDFIGRVAGSREDEPVRLLSRQKEAEDLEKTGSNIKSKLKEAGWRRSATGSRS